MLKNKNINIILAFIIAVSLWAYVLGDVNPKTEVVIKEVPIVFENEEALSNAGLVILNYDYASVNVTITGPRTEVTKVSKGDFSVTADVEGLTVGSNIVRLDITGPDNVKISDVSTEKVSVTVDEWISESRDVEVQISGTAEDHKEPLIVEKSRDSVYVSGAKSLVKKVEKAIATVDVDKVGNELETLNAKLQAVDVNGNVVNYVYLDTESINITAIMHQKKTVNLEVPIDNETAGGYERTVKVPKTIVIKGEAALLEDIGTITCKSIDLSKYVTDTSVVIEPVLPYGVEISSDSKGLNVEIKVKKLSKTTVKIKKDDIKINNASEELKYDINTSGISIEVSGKEADVLTINAADFNVYVDVMDLQAGTHTIDLVVETDKNLSSMEVSEKQIEIIIE